MVNSNKKTYAVLTIVYAAILAVVFMTGEDVFLTIKGAAVIIGMLLLYWFIDVWEPRIFGFLMVLTGLIIIALSSIAGSLFGSILNPGFAFGMSFLPNPFMMVMQLFEALSAVFLVGTGALIYIYASKDKHKARRFFGRFYLITLIFFMLTDPSFLGTQLQFLTVHYMYVTALPLFLLFLFAMRRFWAVTRFDKGLLALLSILVTINWMAITPTLGEIPGYIGALFVFAVCRT